MRSATMYLAAVDLTTLVRGHDLHAGGFTHHAALWSDTNQGKFRQQHGNSQAANLLVITEGDMNRSPKSGFCELPAVGQRNPDKPCLLYLSPSPRD